MARVHLKMRIGTGDDAESMDFKCNPVDDTTARALQLVAVLGASGVKPRDDDSAELRAVKIALAAYLDAVRVFDQTPAETARAQDLTASSGP